MGNSLWHAGFTMRGSDEKKHSKYHHRRWNAARWLAPYYGSCYRAYSPAIVVGICSILPNPARFCYGHVWISNVSTRWTAKIVRPRIVKNPHSHLPRWGFTLYEKHRAITLYIQYPSDKKSHHTALSLIQNTLCLVLL